MLNVFPWTVAFETSFKCLSTGKIIKLVMIYCQHCSDIVWKWSKCDVKKGSFLVMPAGSQHCDLQVVHCESLKILRWLLLLASSSNSVWEASFEKVPLWSLAKINPFPSFPTTQLQLRFRGGRQGLSNVGKEGTSWIWPFATQRSCSSAQKTTGCHITGIALFAGL